ncbi:hypothetical protein [Shouchella shacheensis]|uniref:hypothetical protein n=1 Tax=Shouchella shacheensis TaxID=1649580 RepID=UPI000AC8ABCD|nr:hypothetical protein [Shouchella shacheensis]
MQSFLTQEENASIQSLQKKFACATTEKEMKQCVTEMALLEEKARLRSESDHF